MATDSLNKNPSASWWFCLTPAVVMFLLFFLLIWNNIIARVGTFVYPLDDAYINTAMANNLVQQGTWGTNAGEFSATSSSPAYTFLTALIFWVTGPNDLVPLGLNLAAALVLLVVAYLILRKAPVWIAAGTLVAVVVLTPLAPLVFSGLEHVYHSLLVLLFIGLVVPSIADPAMKPGRGHVIALLMVTLLLPITRYESLFVLFMVCLLLAARGRWGLMLLVALAAAASTGLVGLYFYQHGGAPLPNSVLMKGQSAVLQVDSPAVLLDRILSLVFDSSLLLETYPLGLSLLLLFALASRRHSFWTPAQLWTIIAVATLMLHILLARIGFYRYEAYLLVLGLVAIGLSLHLQAEELFAELKTWPVRLAFGLAIAYLIYPLFYRGTVAVRNTPVFSTNIHDQQVQMSRFVRRYYNHSTIVLNDIGAINYYTQARALDLMGLATTEVMQLRRAGRLDTAAMAQLAQKHQAPVAIAFESWFQGSQALPASWIKVGSWTVSENLICGDKTVSFFGTTPGAAEQLRRQLLDFTVELPRTVQVVIPEVRQARR